VLYYFFVTVVLAVWVWVDGRRRRCSEAPGLAFLTVFLPILSMPIHFAIRPLRAGEVREGGYSWNVCKNIALAWTACVALVAVWCLVSSLVAPASRLDETVTTDTQRLEGAVEVIVGLRVLFWLWLGPVIVITVIGWLLKTPSIIETGPTGALANQTPQPKPLPEKPTVPPVIQDHSPPSVIVDCPTCGSRYEVPPDMEGQPVNCRKCGELLAARRDARA